MKCTYVNLLVLKIHISEQNVHTPHILQPHALWHSHVSDKQATRQKETHLCYRYNTVKPIKTESFWDRLCFVLISQVFSL
jgi:hypothetical protein